MTVTQPGANTVRTFRLKNPFGWVLAYEVRGESVTIRRTYRGCKAGSFDVSRVIARLHYRDARQDGFEKMEGP